MGEWEFKAHSSVWKDRETLKRQQCLLISREFHRLFQVIFMLDKDFLLGQVYFLFSQNQQ